MDLYLLDKDFEICGLIDDFSSLIWNRKYYECGNFSLLVALKYLDQFKNAKYVYSNKFIETAVLETLDFKTTKSGTQIKRTGRFLESILAQRVIDTTQYFRNMITEDIIRSLVNTFVINAPDERKISNVVLGERKGLGKTRTLQVKGENLLDYIYELCKEDELSIHFRYDFDNKQLVFEVWQGLDRRDSQDENSWAIFCENFENIADEDYSYNETKYCNFAYVEGEIEEQTGTDSSGMPITTKRRVGVTIDRVKPGEDRRELYVDARDLQKDEDTTDAEYLEMLKERGISKLNENTKVEKADFKIDALSNLEYKKDFDIGDVVVYKNNKLGYDLENRLVEVTESYENGDKNIDVTFGEDYNLKKMKGVI